MMRTEREEKVLIEDVKDNAWDEQQERGTNT